MGFYLGIFVWSDCRAKVQLKSLTQTVPLCGWGGPPLPSGPAHSSSSTCSYIEFCQQLCRCVTASLCVAPGSRGTEPGCVWRAPPGRAARLRPPPQGDTPRPARGQGGAGCAMGPRAPVDRRSLADPLVWSNLPLAVPVAIYLWCGHYVVGLRCRPPPPPPRPGGCGGPPSTAPHVPRQGLFAARGSLLTASSPAALPAFSTVQGWSPPK